MSAFKYPLYVYVYKNGDKYYLDSISNKLSKREKEENNLLHAMEIKVKNKEHLDQIIKAYGL